jgi:hypothetical protein
VEVFVTALKETFLTFSILTDIHVLKLWWIHVSLCLFYMFLP